MKKIIELQLKLLAKLILKKYQPEVIGISGSIGKTSSKEAIYAVLKTQHKVRRNIKNYNNEIGLPLTIIGCESPGKNIFGWLKVFWQAKMLLFIKQKDYPEILVLEMGIDRPGDMEYLIDIIKPNIGVLTAIGTVHAEFFADKAALAEEKIKLIKSLPPTGRAILNFDSTEIQKAIKFSKAKILTYGLNEGASVRAEEISYEYKMENQTNKLVGIKFKLTYKKDSISVFLPAALGIGAVYSALAASAAGIIKGLSLKEISKALRNIEQPKGRMRLMPGIKYTTLIDDTYNSEPESAMAALRALTKIKTNEGTRRFAVLGDMLELGKYSEAAHRDIGKYAAKCGIDKLIAVGERARDIARGAIEAGMKSDFIFRFPQSEEAGKFLQDRIKQGDLILIKGSQGIRMEKIVLEIMAEPQRAKELLVRQDNQWQ